MPNPFPELKFVKNSQRFKIASTCPCGKDNRDNKFVPFEGYADKGYCHSCGENFLPELPPSERQEENTRLKGKIKRKNPGREKLEKPTTEIPFELFEQSVTPSNIYAVRANSSLFKGLLGNRRANIPEERIIEAMNRFYIGFSGYRFTFPTAPNYISPQGANVLWLIDERNRVRGGQVVLFDYESPTCSTQKKPDRHTRPVYLAIGSSLKRSGLPVPSWLKEYKAEQGNKMPCLFGLPQLKKESITKPIAICEAPKTALVGWIYYPEYIWLAVGSKGMLKATRLKPLAGRSITLFPDLSADGGTFDLWNKAVHELKKELGGNWIASRILEDAPDLTEQERKGGDVADYLLSRWNWEEFQKAKVPPLETMSNGSGKPGKAEGKNLFPYWEKTPDEKQRIATKPENNLNSELLSITSEIEELESFFSSFIPPDGPLKLDSATTIKDIPAFVRSHMATIKASNGRRSFKPYFDRLLLLKEIITKSNNN